MKKYLFPILSVVFLLGIDNNASAQRGRYYRGHPIYHSRPTISFGIGTGFYGMGIRRYGWGPAIGVSVVVPPPGAKVSGLPPNVSQIEINGITYYHHNNTYFRERQDGGFEVVEAPIGARLSKIPMGAKLQKIDGKYYYEKNGTFYYKDVDAEGNDEYVIAGKNGAINTDDELYADDVYSEGNETYNENDEPVVKNGNEQDATTDKTEYVIRPQVGDRFDQLPRNCKELNVDGKKVFVSPNGIHYKELNEDGRVVYEVIKEMN